jgi:RNA polymerase sigma-70 factor, ECF subfamily
MAHPAGGRLHGRLGVDLGELHRREFGRLVATLTRVVKDIGLAEDSVQDAFAAAQGKWVADEWPEQPVAWLMATARHKAIDAIRRRALAGRKEEEMIALLTPGDFAPEPTDRLRLIFTCCHPALSPEARVALTLKTVCGLETGEIARAFLVPISTLAQRLVRAKAKIKLAGIPYEVPGEERLVERLEAVLAVVYLVFNEGYSAAEGSELMRAGLCDEAIRLGRELEGLLPMEGEVKGLLALMLFNDARRSTRCDENGDLVLLEDQDRCKWNAGKIEEARVLLDRALAGGRAGFYAMQAAIAALHASARSWEETDWEQIAGLYGLLAERYSSPVIELNRAVAIAMWQGPEAGLGLLDGMDLPDYHLLPAARADLLRRSGRREEAAAAYDQALLRVTNESERRFLEKRLAELRKRPIST